MAGKAAIGLDYGTSTTILAWGRSGDPSREEQASEPHVVELGSIHEPAARGEERTFVSSTLAWPRDRQESLPLVGSAAERCSSRDYVVLRSLKRCLRCTRDKDRHLGKCFNPQNEELCAGLGRYAIDGTTYTTPQLIESYLTTVVRRFEESPEAKSEAGPVECTVRLGVPGDFGPDLRAAMNAIALTGFRRDHVESEVLDEPTAALRYIYSQLLGKPNPGLHVVLDVGGGSTDIAVLSLDPNGVLLVHPPQAIPTAGDDFDEALFQHFGADMTERSHYEKRVVLRAVKHALGDRREIPGFPLQKVKTVLAPVAKQISEFLFTQVSSVVDSHREIGFSEPPAVETLYLVGGGSRLPLIRDVLQNDPRYDVVGRPHLVQLPRRQSISGLHAIGLGLALPASEIFPVSLGWLPCRVEVRDGRSMPEVFESGTPLPTKWVGLTLSRHALPEIALRHSWGNAGGDILDESQHATRRDDLRPRNWLQQRLTDYSQRVHIRVNAASQLEIHLGYDPERSLGGEVRWRFDLPWRSRFVERRRAHEVNEIREAMGLPPFPC